MPDIHPAAPRSVALEVIFPSKTNPRTHFPASDLAEMEASIRKHGVFQPLLLRVHPSKAGHYEIVDGERRFRGAKQAGLSEVPASVGTFSDEQVLEVQIVSFLSRKDITPLEEAHCFNTMLKRYSHERIAEKVGRSVDYVRDRCRLLSLVKAATEFLDASRIELGHALELAKLTPDNQVRAIRFEGGGLWERQRSLPTTSDAAAGPRKNDDEFKAVTVKELKGWIADHCRLDVKAPENAVLFPTIAAAVEPEEGKWPDAPRKKVIHITWDGQSSDDVRKEKGERIYTNRAWVRADGRLGSKTCASSVMGAVVCGTRDYGQAFDVCVAKKSCAVHYKKEIAEAQNRESGVARSGKTGADRYALEEKKRQEAAAKENQEVARFEAARPALLRDLAERIKPMPVKASGPIAALISNAIRQTYGHHSAELGKVLPAGKSVEDLLRHLAFIVAGAQAFCWHARSSFPKVAKAFGVDVEKTLAAQAAPIVAKCRVCECTETTPCRSRKTPTGPMEACFWAEAPNKKTGLGLCSACAEKTGQKAPTKSKAKK